MPETILSEEIEEILRQFNYDHLPEHLRVISKPFCELAHSIGGKTPKNKTQLRLALTFLMLAKDAAVRTEV